MLWTGMIYFFRYNTGWMSGKAYDNRLNTFGKKNTSQKSTVQGF